MALFLRRKLEKHFPGRVPDIMNALRSNHPPKLRKPWWKHPDDKTKTCFLIAAHIQADNIPRRVEGGDDRGIPRVLDQLCRARASKRARDKQYQVFVELVAGERRRISRQWTRYLRTLDFTFPAGFGELIGENLAATIVTGAWLIAIGEPNSPEIMALLKLFDFGSPVVYVDSGLRYVTLLTLPEDA